MESKFKYSREGRYLEWDPNGYLYSEGIYPTKILPKDLPEWYVHGHLYKQYGYISAKGVKHLLYKPNYHFDEHLHKDDFLYISYGKEIDLSHRGGWPYWHKGYDELIYGMTILDFVDAAEKHSGYDVTEIRNEIERKTKWYQERNPDWKRWY